LGIYLITGGAGFIGSHLADALLADGHEVRVLDDLSTGRIENVDPRCSFIRADVTNETAVRTAMAGVSGCFHLAAIASVERGNEDWLGTHRVNQTATLIVLDAARACGGIPVVYASSAAVYGDIGQVSAREEMHPMPQTAYGADKRGGELHGYVGYNVHKVPNLGLRFFNVYGPRQDPLSPYSGVISIFARLAATGGSILVHGDGSQTRDFVYVSDVAAHMIAAMRHLQDRGGVAVVNVCTGRGTSILSLARSMLAARGISVGAILHGPVRAGDIRHSVGDPSAARALFGLSADVTLEEGLAKTLASFVSAESPSALAGL